LKSGVLVPRLSMDFADVGQHRDVLVAVNDQRLHIRLIASTMDNELGIHAEEAGFVVWIRLCNLNKWDEAYVVGKNLGSRREYRHRTKRQNRLRLRDVVSKELRMLSDFCRV
jgi:hypothetical protein